MKKEFLKNAEIKIQKAAQFLKELGIQYQNPGDGTLRAFGEINISNRGLEKLPDLSCVILSGDFDCSGNELTSLKGSPQSVEGHFFCFLNKLTSLKGSPKFVKENFICISNNLHTLEGAPKYIGRKFNCGQNKLTTLEHAPEFIGRSFWCHNNHLISLQGAPKYIHKNFMCHGNKLSSLKNGPEIVSGEFNCANNKLTSIEYAPKKIGEDFNCQNNDLKHLEDPPEQFKTLISDFGTFLTKYDIPISLRLSQDSEEKLKVLNQKITKEEEAQRIKKHSIYTQKKIQKLKQKKSPQRRLRK